MTVEKKPVRLSKVAREFNIGISTIVEYLKKKGHEVESNPNTKISPELYSILLDEFKSEKTVKEEAAKIGLDFTNRETISIQDRKSTTETIDKEIEQEELIIKNVAAYQVDTLKQEEKAPDVPEIIEEKDSPIVKIPEEKEEVVEEKPPIEKKPEEKPEEKPKRKARAKKALKETKEDAVETIEKKKKTAKATTGEESKTKEADHPKEADVAKPDKASPLKIIGTIDLETIDPKKPAKKKTKEKEKKKEEESKKPKKKDKESKKPKKKEEDIVEKETVLEEKPKEVDVKEKEDKSPETELIVEEENLTKEENFIKTEFEKLKGPTIIGSIKLPEIKKPEKKPVASSTDEKVKEKKKKRKRIKKHPGDINKINEGGQKTARSKTKFKDKKGKKEILKPEPSAEDVEKQIKETLQRLSSTGKSKGAKHRKLKREHLSESRQKESEKLEDGKKVIQLTEFVTANDLATLMNVQVNEIISTCMTLGLFVSINQRLDAETLSLVAEEFGFDVEFVSVEVQELLNHQDNHENPEDITDRAPIVTVMGHVDHGKTSLLDYIRKTNVIAGEAGGITQHIGAYEVKVGEDKYITFLDTPGHEAFTAMRARGAKITDVAIIVIAADDSIMPQTVEAINHAQAAGVPMVFAINKIDKPNANPEKIKEGLSKINILVEDWGGKAQSQEISAKKGDNVNLLLEKVLLEAEMLELKGNPQKPAFGSIIESSLDKGRGYVVKFLVQNGTLRIGDIVLAGNIFGKVKAMYNERNVRINEAGPSTPVLILGLNGAPQAGDLFNVMKDEREAKAISTKRTQLQREQGIRTQKHITLDEIGRRIAIGDFKELNIIVKADVDGSVEALSDSLQNLSTEEVLVNIIHKSVGQVTESDVLLASASNAIIIGFQVRPSLGARKLAEKEEIDIRLYSVIYTAKEEIKSAIEGMLSPDIEEKIICNLEIREVFKITKVGTVAGCMVLDGKISRNTKIRLIRDGIVIYQGMLGSLKRFKDDVKEVQSGYECGLNIENFNDLKLGDIIEGYEEKEIQRKL
ncbi:MAG: translation initiation factor IF-2 [Bacteroidales bacterium]|nr:translation initiation factor IF-2 [Bacteroidales bacterium]